MYAIRSYYVVGDSIARRWGATDYPELLAKLAEHVANVILDDFGAIWVRITIAKIGVMRGVRRAGVVIERSRPCETI